MAGPGGGSRGGGFSGGSFGGSRGGGSFGGSFGGNFGGGHNGGSFGGGFGGHHHGHHRGGYSRPYFGTGYPRTVHRSSGCGCLVVPVFIIFFLVVVLLSFTGNITIVEDNYDEAIFQDYANENYYDFFADTSAPEDNILLVFLANEDADGYYTIAWVGDNVDYEINEMFGEYTDYGDAMYAYVNQTYYGYSLDTDYVRVINYMADSIDNLELESSFVRDSDRSSLADSVAVNRTTLDFDEAIVNEALSDFTERTGIPCVLVIDYDFNVFVSQTDGEESDGEEFGGAVVVIILSVIAIIAVAVVLIIKYNKKKGNESKPETNEKCGEEGCDGKVNPGEKPPWEF